MWETYDGIPLEEDPNLQDENTEYRRGCYHYDRGEYHQALSAFEMAAAYGHQTVEGMVEQCYFRLAEEAAEKEDWRDVRRMLDYSRLSQAEKKEFCLSLALKTEEAGREEAARALRKMALEMPD